MPRSNFLDRFRPVGSPGPAARTGVPAKDAVSPADELATVFAALAGDVERCRAAVEAARLEGERVRERARDEAAARVASSRLEAAMVRRAAYDRVLAAAAQEDTRLAQAAAERAERITRAGRARVPAMARRIAESILTEAAGE